jgi:hypothetical protein
MARAATAPHLDPQLSHLLRSLAVGARAGIQSLYDRDLVTSSSNHAAWFVA